MSCDIDLHTHSNASDGELSPAAVVRRAKEKGVCHLALTDHDTTSGIAEAQSAASRAGVRLIPGVELSVTWDNRCLHVLGLNIDPKNQGLSQGLEQLRETRIQRAQKIGGKLEKKGIFGAFEGAAQLAGPGMITRTHFSRFLVGQGHCPTLQRAFDQYLGRGKDAYVPTEWVEMETGLAWIRAAGGIAVLAHPLRYKFTATGMRKLLEVFRAAGGQGIEVVCGNSTPDDVQVSARFARDFGLLGSVGSDFHSPGLLWNDVGRLRDFPRQVEPVWTRLGIQSVAFAS